MEKFDLVVIGSGPGGYPAAIRAAQLGASVAVVEKEFPGGTCLNWGCIPTKTLIASSDLYWRVKHHGGRLGVNAPSASFNYGVMVKRKVEVVQTLRNGVAQLLKGNGVKVFQGVASFDGRNRLKVSQGRDETLVETRSTIIATGSESAMPGFIPKSESVLESRGFLDRTALPDSLIVLGGGVIGCEFACMAAQLGCKVTIAEMLEDILIVLDADVRRELRRRMENELGIRVLTGKPMQDIAAVKKNVSGRVGEEKIEAECMLVSVGRRPYTAGLGLDRAGIELAPSGHIPIDQFCQTRVAGIYAIGDVTAGSTQLAHAATSQGITAAQNACGKGRAAAETLVPACIFTSPEIGSVGMTEQKAKEAGFTVQTGKFPFAALGKALAAGEPEGFVKWVADEKTGCLLGAHAVGAHATELITEATLAIRAELLLEDVGRTIHCHPTFSESWMEAAHAAHGECIHAAPRRKK